MKVIRMCFVWAAAFLFFGGSFSFPAKAQTRANHKPPLSKPPATLEGNWAGSLEAGDAVLHLVLHVSKAEDGSFKATIDSLDQGVYGIEVTNLTQHGSEVRFSVSSVDALYEGKISADHSGIQGVWSQGNVGLALIFHRQVAGAGARKPDDAIFSSEGVWQGALEANGLRLRFQLHVTHDDKKQLVAALDSPDQGIGGMPAVKVSQKLTVFHFEIPLVDGVYEGTINPTKSVISGIWTQGGITRNLKFERSDQLLELVRPQNPVRPYPYREEQVTFANPKAQVSLAGTLTVPRGPGSFPAAILIAGSGPQDRDETVAGHRPFLVLADHLTRKGIAVLRYDKRGIGKSTGNFDQATTEDFAHRPQRRRNHCSDDCLALRGRRLDGFARGSRPERRRRHAAPVRAHFENGGLRRRPHRQSPQFQPAVLHAGAQGDRPGGVRSQINRSCGLHRHEHHPASHHDQAPGAHDDLALVSFLS